MRSSLLFLLVSVACATAFKLPNIFGKHDNSDNQHWSLFPFHHNRHHDDSPSTTAASPESKPVSSSDDHTSATESAHEAETKSAPVSTNEQGDAPASSDDTPPAGAPASPPNAPVLKGPVRRRREISFSFYKDFPCFLGLDGFDFGDSSADSEGRRRRDAEPVEDESDSEGHVSELREAVANVRKGLESVFGHNAENGLIAAAASAWESDDRLEKLSELAGKVKEIYEVPASHISSAVVSDYLRDEGSRLADRIRGLYAGHEESEDSTEDSA